MLTIEVAIRIHHFRLNPDAEVHPQRVHLLDHGPQAVRKLLLVQVPVAQAAVIVVALTKPAIINHKSLYSEPGRFLRKSDLCLVGKGHFRGFPRVENDGARLWRGGRWAERQDLVGLESVFNPRRLAVAAVRIARVELW